MGGPASSLLSKRGFCGIGIYQTKKPINIGSLWRSALAFETDWIFTIGCRYEHQASDTMKVPRHIPLYHYQSFQDFEDHRPFDCRLVGIEPTPSSIDINVFVHPKRAIYLLGAEDYGLPEEVLLKCQDVVHIRTPMRLNVAVAGSIVLFDRTAKRNQRRQHAASPGGI